MKFITQLIVALGLVWLQIAGLSACMLDQATAYQVITGIEKGK